MDDEKLIPMAIGRDSGLVVIKFPEPIAYLKLTPEQAVIMAEVLEEMGSRTGDEPRSGN